MNSSQLISKIILPNIFLRQEEMCPYWKCHPVGELSDTVTSIWEKCLRTAKLCDSLERKVVTGCRRACLPSFPREGLGGGCGIQEWKCLWCSDFVSETGRRPLTWVIAACNSHQWFSWEVTCHLLLQKCFTPSSLLDKRQMQPWFDASPYRSSLLFVFLKYYTNLV